MWKCAGYVCSERRKSEYNGACVCVIGKQRTLIPCYECLGPPGEWQIVGSGRKEKWKRGWRLREEKAIWGQFLRGKLNFDPLWCIRLSYVEDFTPLSNIRCWCLFLFFVFVLLGVESNIQMWLMADFSCSVTLCHSKTSSCCTDSHKCLSHYSFTQNRAKGGGTKSHEDLGWAEAQSSLSVFLLVPLRLREVAPTVIVSIMPVSSLLW